MLGGVSLDTNRVFYLVTSNTKKKVSTIAIIRLFQVETFKIRPPHWDCKNGQWNDFFLLISYFFCLASVCWSIYYMSQIQQAPALSPIRKVLYIIEKQWNYRKPQPATKAVHWTARRQSTRHGCSSILRRVLVCHCNCDIRRRNGRVEYGDVAQSWHREPKATTGRQRHQAGRRESWRPAPRSCRTQSMPG